MIKVYEHALARLFPERCPRCASPSVAGYCLACRAELRRVRDPCRACGLARGTRRCPRRALSWRIEAVTAPFAYEEPIVGELVALKRVGGRQLGRALGLLLADEIGAADTDVAVPVPLHPARLRERGFNQAVEIARAIGTALDMRVRAHGAVRTRSTRLQPGLDPVGRAANVEGAFGAVGRYDGMRVAIVDDVMTSGATANALAKVLRAAGAAHVEAWAVARARP